VTDRIGCASGVELLMDFLEDALPADLRADIEAHVASCARCTAFVASYRATPRIFRAATLARLPEDLEKSLLAFLRRRR
jgi:anti-sigma factor RsiW